MKYRTSYSLQKMFDTVKVDILCNTSYPLKPLYFSDYKGEADIMTGVNSLSFYFHIPFCNQLCKFCEYTRFLSRGNYEEDQYVDALIKQAENYQETHPVNLLYGLDVGGGTPTSLNVTAFKKVVDYVSGLLKKHQCGENFESSMEFSFSTIDDKKISLLEDSGIHRMSTGIQIYDKEILDQNQRKMHSILQMKDTLDKLHSVGIKKCNLDIMYGFTKQNMLTIHNTLRIIELLAPEQVTLYEMRYNLNNLEYESISRQVLFEQYTALYDSLISFGYQAQFGMNTFSLYNDHGVSSYLRTRMLEAKPYKGFGISAQSMSQQGISYNTLKNSAKKHVPAYDNLKEEDVYILPPEEIAAKYVSISLYSGSFSMRVLSSIMNTNAEQYYREELYFLKEKKMLISMI